MCAVGKAPCRINGLLSIFSIDERLIDHFFADRKVFVGLRRIFLTLKVSQNAHKKVIKI